jgi:hypothetical protein
MRGRSLERGDATLARDWPPLAIMYYGVSGWWTLGLARKACWPGLAAVPFRWGRMG